MGRTAFGTGQSIVKNASLCSVQQRSLIMTRRPLLKRTKVLRKIHKSFPAKPYSITEPTWWIMHTNLEMKQPLLCALEDFQRDMSYLGAPLFWSFRRNIWKNASLSLIRYVYRVFGIPQQVCPVSNNVFHIHLMRGLQKYKRNLKIMMAFWAKDCSSKFRSRHSTVLLQCLLRNLLEQSLKCI